LNQTIPKGGGLAATALRVLRNGPAATELRQVTAARHLSGTGARSAATPNRSPNKAPERSAPGIPHIADALGWPDASAM